MAQRTGGLVPLSALSPALVESAAALWATAHAPPCAGHGALDAEALVLLEEGEVAGVGVTRTWGRTAQVHGLVVDERFRRRGFGAALLDALIALMLRGDASVIGLEVDGAGAAALTVLARAGFKPMQLSFVLEAESVSSDEAASAVRILSGADAAAACEASRELAASVDAEMDPSEWLLRVTARGEADLAVIDGAQALALVGRPTEGAEVMVATMTLVDEGPPYERLAALVAGISAHARARGIARVQVAAPSRYWEPVRSLLDLGMRPGASFLRLTRQGFPERADTRRVNLASWR
jgi:GNAT superfamily N-acetyltransferase